MSLGLMSPVEFKKWPCRRVDFKGLDPFIWVNVHFFFSKISRQNFRKEMRGSAPDINNSISVASGICVMHTLL